LGNRLRPARGFGADAVIEELAARQHGIVTRGQLLGAGASQAVIDRRVHAKRLCVVHHGVYRVGPIASPCAREMAAVLACGPCAAVSHRSAARVRGWRAAAGPADSDVDVIVRHSHGGRRPGIRRHRMALAPDEVTGLHGIPITTPERTLLDLAGVLRARELERTLAQAEEERLASRPGLLLVLARRPRHPGARRLREVLRAEAPPALTKSTAEDLFLEIIEPTPLPQPEANVWVRGFRVDFYWPAERLVVEVDGFAFHSSHRMFEKDRARDAALAAAGLRVIRITWKQLVEEPATVLVRIAQALARAGSP
jgi:hypothetical protein